MSDAMLSETIEIPVGDESIPAYIARPLDESPRPGVVVIHHMPGWDESTKEITRTFGRRGYTAICPHLHHRDAPGASEDDAAAASRAAGGVPDSRSMGDITAAAAYLKGLSTSNGKVGVIGYCSGGRQAWLAACLVDNIDAAVSCYSGGVIMPEDRLSEAMPVSPIDHAPAMHVPLLGLYGKEDRFPSPDQVEEMDRVLTELGKPHEFHSYEGAGHGFFSVNRDAYRVDAAMDGWERIWAFFDRELAG